MKRSGSMKWIGLMLGISLSTAALGTNGVGNGGESLSMEFTRLGHEVYLALSTNSSTALLSPDQLKDLRQALNTTRVDAVKGPIIDSLGREVDARVIFDERYKEKVIEINRNTWLNFISMRGRVHRLVFHEYLRVLEVNDDNYVVSSLLEGDPFLAFFNVSSPILSENKFYEKLSEYFAAGTKANWDDIVGGRSSREFYSVECFVKGNDLGREPDVSFRRQRHGPVLEPSKVIVFTFSEATTSGIAIQKEDSLYSDLLPVYPRDNYTVTFQAKTYGKTLVVHLASRDSLFPYHRDSYCYMLPRPDKYRPLSTDAN